MARVAVKESGEDPSLPANQPQALQAAAPQDPGSVCVGTGTCGDAETGDCYMADVTCHRANGDSPAFVDAASCLQGVGVCCGDGIVWGDEECDDGSSDSAVCDADGTWAYCGDGTVNPLAGEDCDAGAGGDDTGYCLADGTRNPEFIPTVSEWALIVTALLMLTAGTLLYTRRRRMPGVPEVTPPPIAR